MTSERAAGQLTTSENEDRAGGRVPFSSIALLLMAAAILGFGCVLLHAPSPMCAPDTTENWLVFGQRCLSDMLGAATILCLALVLALFFPRIGIALEGLVLRSSRRSFLAFTVGFSIVTSALFAWFIMDHTTHIPDETAMLFQARILASGRLYAEAPPVPQAFDYEFIIADGGKWYGKYFIGQSLFLVPGVWLGVPWLVHPILIGVCAWLTYLLGLDLFNEKIARVATMVMALSPLRLFLGGTMMGHASSLIMLTLVALALVRIVRDPGRWGWGLVAGTFLGLAFNARPLTAAGMGGAMFATVAICFPWRRFDWRTAACFILAFGAFVAVFLGYNKALTGNAFKTPFNQWSQNDRLGFGSDVGLEYWLDADKGHSLRRGLFVDSYYNLDALGQSLTGWGQLTLLLIFLPLVLPSWRGRGWMLVAVWLALAGIHVLHVSSGVLMGQPRYWSEAMPMLLLLVAVSLAWFRSRLPGLCRHLGLVPAVRTGRSAAWIAGSGLVLVSLWLGHWSLIVDQCGWVWGQRQTVRRLMEARGLDRAIVFVKSGHYRTQLHGGVIDVYPASFVLNDPDLRAPVIFARDLGPELNARVLHSYPDRTAWYLDPRQGADMDFVPLSKVQTLPAS